MYWSRVLTSQKKKKNVLVFNLGGNFHVFSFIIIFIINYHSKKIIIIIINLGKFLPAFVACPCLALGPFASLILCWLLFLWLHLILIVNYMITNLFYFLKSVMILYNTIRIYTTFLSFSFLCFGFSFVWGHKTEYYLLWLMFQAIIKWFKLSLFRQSIS